MLNETDPTKCAPPWYVEKTKERISRNSPVDDLTGCWNWSKTKGKKGFHFYTGFYGRTYSVQRLVLYLFKGVLPGTEIIDSTCKNPQCVNPEHLYLPVVTPPVIKASRLRALPVSVVNEVQNMLARGMKVHNIARKFGISRGVVYNIRKKFSLINSTHKDG